jgi:hypothetical protein
MKKQIAIIFSAICFLLTGCATSITKRGMLDDNTYYSTYNPNIQIKVSPDFSYHAGKSGQFQHQFKNNIERKYIYIHHFKESPNPGPIDYYYNPSSWIFSDVPQSEKIESGTVNILNKKWYYCHYFRQSSTGSCALLKDIAIFTRDHDILKIRYIKELPRHDCDDWDRQDVDAFKAEFSKDIEITNYEIGKDIEQKAKEKEIGRDDRFIAYSNGVVEDTKTGLEWYAGPDKNTTWDKAKSWVQNLTIDGGGWRMPTINELKTLYQQGVGTRNMTPLLKITGWWVWSEQTAGSGSAYAFEVGLNAVRRHSLNRKFNSRGFAVRSQKELSKKEMPVEPVKTLQEKRTGMQPQRTFENNTFTSDFPELCVKIHRSYIWDEGKESKRYRKSQVERWWWEVVLGTGVGIVIDRYHRSTSFDYYYPLETVATNRDKIPFETLLINGHRWLKYAYVDEQKYLHT